MAPGDRTARPPLSRRARRNVRRARTALRLLRRGDVATLRAVLWSGRELRRLRRVLPHGGLGRVSLRRPPPLPDRAVRGVEALARARNATCLERSLILQSWLAARGREHEIVIGVATPENGFHAHAWLQGYDDESTGAGYDVLTRIGLR
jgi:hypothetical protein